MKCPRCGAQNQEDARFCEDCGAQDAQEHLTTATTMYREMGMTYWLEKAEAEIRNLA